MPLTVGRLCDAMRRRKSLSAAEEDDPVSSPEGTARLRRVLNFTDLTALGVGSTLGVGVFVLAGHVARDVAGPSVILSFTIAALASLFAGLCYAEFGGREPLAGSAYTYSYICAGELVAFIIGWNLILEYVIGSASVARAVSLYLDSMLDGAIGKAFDNILPLTPTFLAHHVDLFAFALVILLAVALAFGVKKSTLINNIFSVLNLAVVVFVIIAGGINIDFKNWNINPAAVSAKDNAKGNIGSGGFFPFGVMGTIRGAATCFYGFIGFDCIATTGEEVREPRKVIPRAILASLLIVFISYFGVSAVVTLMWPYYDQNRDAPLPYVFEAIGWDFAKWIVAIGGLFGLITSLFGVMFPLPRILYAMANDGLIFRFLGNVSPKFNTPVIGTLLAGLFTGFMAALFDLEQLVNMMSIGTLMAYTMVAACVLLLRYDVSDYDYPQPQERSILVSRKDYVKRSIRDIMGQIINKDKLSIPTSLSSNVVTWLICVYGILCLALSLSLIYGEQALSGGEPWALCLSVTLALLLLLDIGFLCLQPTNVKPLTFSVPLVPLIPSVSIFINIYLMFMLDPATWIRFGIWMTAGILVLLLKNSCMRKNSDSSWMSVTKRSRTQVPIRNNPISSVELPNNINYAYENCVEIETCNEIKQESIMESDQIYSVLPDLVIPTKMTMTRNKNEESDETASLEDKIKTSDNKDNNIGNKKISEKILEPAESILAYFDDMLNNEDSESYTQKSSPPAKQNSNLFYKTVPNVDESYNNSKILSKNSSLHSDESSENCSVSSNETIKKLESIGTIQTISDTNFSSARTSLNSDNNITNENEFIDNTEQTILEKDDFGKIEVDPHYPLNTEKISGYHSVRNSLFAQKLEKLLGGGVSSTQEEISMPKLQEKSKTLQHPKQKDTITSTSVIYPSTSNHGSSNIPIPPKMPTADILTKMQSSPANLNKLRTSVIPLFDLEEKNDRDNIEETNIEKAQIINNDKKLTKTPHNICSISEKILSPISNRHALKQNILNMNEPRKSALVTITPYETSQSLSLPSIEENINYIDDSPVENNSVDETSVMSRADLKVKLNNILAHGLIQSVPDIQENLIIADTKPKPNYDSIGTPEHNT